MCFPEQVQDYLDGVEGLDRDLDEEGVPVGHGAVPETRELEGPQFAALVTLGADETGFGIHMLQEMHRTVEALSGKLAVKPVMLVQKVESMEEEIKELKRQIDAMSREKLADSIDSVIAKKALAGGINLYVGKLDGEDMNHLREAGDKYKDSDPNAVFIVFSQAAEDKVQLLCMIGEEAQKKKLHAGRIVKELAAIVGGSGGGRPNMAQAGGKDPSKIPAAAEAAVDVVTKMIGA